MRRGRHLRAVAAALLVLALVVALAALVACGAPAPVPAAPTAAPPPPVDAVFVGRSGDGAVAVAIAMRDGRATGFVSNGSDLGAWFDGGVDGGVVDLRGRDGSELVGAVHGRVVHGAVTLASGQRWAVAAVAASEPAGLYTAEAGADRTGWVRLPDGTVVGTAEIAGRVRPAPELGSPDAAGDAGIGPRRVAGGEVPAR